MELRKELASATSLNLPPMLVFDYPSAAALTDHLLALMPPQPVVISGPPAGGRQPVVQHEVQQAPIQSTSSACRETPLCMHTC